MHKIARTNDINMKGAGALNIQKKSGNDKRDTMDASDT